jgi:hypothetical protein
MVVFSGAITTIIKIIVMLVDLIARLILYEGCEYSFNDECNSVGREFLGFVWLLWA